ncbi:MAG: hypothetical protein ABSH20_20435, partial [Tepidisphaeraceae bacterium]
MKRKPTFAYAQLNARIMPVARGKRFETPLTEALAKNGLGEVGGGGTLQLKTGEIEYCGIDVDLFDVEEGSRFVCKFLADRGAPRGSKLCYEHNGKKVELPFGTVEGLAIYLNGTELPPEVYQQSDINVVIDTVDRLLGDRGRIRGYWEGPTETALYLYGNSAQEMRNLIASFVAEYP